MLRKSLNRRKRKLSSLFAAACIAPALLLGGCDDDSQTFDDMEREIDDAAQATGEYLNEQRKEFVAETDEQMNNLEAKFDQLDEKSDEWGEDAQREWAELKANADDRLAEARENLEEAGDESEEAWEDAKDDFEETMNEVEDDYERAAAKFDDDADQS